MAKVDIAGLIAAGRGSVEHGGVRLTLRAEVRRDGEYWYAYRKIDGKTRKVYLGAKAELTYRDLDRAAVLLSDSRPQPTPLDNDFVLGNPVTQPDSEGEVSRLRAELVAVAAERDKLSRELDRVRVLVAQASGRVSRGSNGKPTRNWVEAVRLMDALIEGWERPADR